MKRPILRLWPFYLLILVYGLAYYNVDYFLVPTLIAFGYTKGQVLFIAGLWGFLDMLGGYFAWSGIRGLTAEVFEEDIDFMRKVAGEAEANGLIEQIKIYFIRKYRKFLNNGDGYSAKSSEGKIYVLWDRLSDSMIKYVLGILKGGSYVLIFLIGFSPVPGPRMVSDVFCGSMRWKRGFCTVALGNFCKTIGFVYGWNWIFS